MKMQEVTDTRSDNFNKGLRVIMFRGGTGSDVGILKFKMREFMNTTKYKCLDMKMHKT